MPRFVRASVGGLTVGDGLDVAVVGVINVSPESFYAGSVATSADALLRAATRMRDAGAVVIDVGAMTTAPYGPGPIDAGLEADRLAWAVDLLVRKLDATVSADTPRAAVARAALDAGARVVNDVSGLSGDPAMAPLVARTGAGLILVASGAPPIAGSPAAGPGDPVDIVAARLAAGLAAGRAAGIAADHVVLDPGIGFFRRQAVPWHEWDCRVLAELPRLRALGHPLCVGVSRKSFVGALTGEPDPARRLPGSLAATAAAVLGGAHMIRAHDVAETMQAVRVAEAIRRADARRAAGS
jgi:dihydropteroate synthase